jgi:phosphoserine phosphatase
MDHQSFRFYIPGIVFLIPIYIVVCYITIYNFGDSNIREFVLIGGITTFPAIALPIGWWIFNAYRVWWIMLTKGYENKDFVKLIRKDTKPFYCPLTDSILIDFSDIGDIKSWIKIDIELFRKTFCPFTSKIKFKEEIKTTGIHPKFTEPLSDFILWKDSGYDYARSISTVRYGLESSVFAILLGGLYALGLRYIWLFQLDQKNDKFVFVFWIVFLILLTVVLIATLVIRWKDAGREYDARLILTTLTSMDSNYFDTKYFSDNIPTEITKKIEKLDLHGKPYAAFDLDNTLLIDDIGDAVFAALIKNKLINDFTWKDYQSLIDKDRGAAYKKVIEVMNGLEIKRLKEITYEVLNSKETHIVIDGKNVPIPKPNLIMQSLVSLLITKGIDVYILTASNKISAEIICWKYFGIPASNVLGAEVSIDKTQRIIYTPKEIPYGVGKVNTLKERFRTRPVITAGDGQWDKLLLNYTALEGIRMWLGIDENEFNEIKNKSYQDLSFFHIPRK